MRRLGTLPALTAVTVLLLAGCGDDAVETYEDDQESTSVSGGDPEGDRAGDPEEGTDTEIETGIDGEDDDPDTGGDLNDEPEGTDESEDPADSGSSGSTGSTGSTGEVDAEVVALPSASAAGGTVARELVPVDTTAGLDGFVSQLEDERFVREVRRTAQSASAEGPLYAAVVAVGCDVPPGVSVQQVGSGYEVIADKVADPLPSCLVPVTTVALVSIP